MDQVYSKKNKNKKTILVGMTGRVDSTVAAYLLKKQGHDVIGIGILFNEDADEFPIGEKSGEIISPFGLQFIHDIEKVKGLCDELSIPFYGVHAADLYQAMVQDFFVAARLGGTTFSPLVFSTRLVIKILAEKMETLKADYFATGNYAKISVNKATGAVNLSQSNDLSNDESFQLSRVSPKHALRLILPLSDMRRSEVLKVYNSLGLKLKLQKSEIKGDKLSEAIFMEDERINAVVEKMSSKDLRRAGSIINYVEDTIICDHAGAHLFYIGQDKIKNKDMIKIDPKLKVIKIDHQTGDIYVSLPGELQFAYCELSSYFIGKGKDNTVPIRAYVKFRPDRLKVACQVYPGNNNSAVVHFKKVQKGQLVTGQLVVIYDRAGEGAKVIGTGIVNRSGHFEADGTKRSLPLTSIEKADQLDNENVPKLEETFTF